MKIPALRHRRIDTGDAGFNGAIEQRGDHFVLVYRAGGYAFGTPVVQRACLLDRDYQPLHRPVEFSCGRELDPRILRVGDAYLVVSFYHRLRGPVDPTRSNPCLRTLRVDAGRLEISQPSPLEVEGFPLQRIDKNWVPFLHAGRLHFVYRAEPHEILTADGDGRFRRAHVTRPAFGWRWGTISGGTPAVPTGDGEYLTFFHSFRAPEPGDYRSPRRYFTGAYTFRAAPPFEVVRATPEPLAWDGLGAAGPHPGGHEVVFASGLVRDGDRLRLSYGENDLGTFVVELRLGDVLSALEPLAERGTSRASAEPAPLVGMERT